MPSPRKPSRALADWEAQARNGLMKPHGRFLMEPFLDYCCGGSDLDLNDGDALGLAIRDA